MAAHTYILRVLQEDSFLRNWTFEVWFFKTQMHTLAVIASSPEEGKNGGSYSVKLVVTHPSVQGSGENSGDLKMYGYRIHLPFDICGSIFPLLPPFHFSSASPPLFFLASSSSLSLSLSLLSSSSSSFAHSHYFSLCLSSSSSISFSSTTAIKKETSLPTGRWGRHLTPPLSLSLHTGGESEALRLYWLTWERIWERKRESREGEIRGGGRREEEEGGRGRKKGRRRKRNRREEERQKARGIFFLRISGREAEGRREEEEWQERRLRRWTSSRRKMTSWTSAFSLATTSLSLSLSCSGREREKRQAPFYSWRCFLTFVLWLVVSFFISLATCPT